MAPPDIKGPGDGGRPPNGFPGKGRDVPKQPGNAGSGQGAGKDAFGGAPQGPRNAPNLGGTSGPSASADDALIASQNAPPGSRRHELIHGRVVPNDPAADARQQRLVGANLVRILTLLLDATRRAWVAFKPRSGEAVPRPGSGVDQFTQFVREVIASEAAELIRLQGLVPITVFRRGSVDGRPAEMGSAQEWVVGARRWTDFPPNARPRVAAADAQTALFFDALFGNSDRRKENILFLDRGDGTYRPILIDNGLILPRRSPHDFVFPQILSQGPLDPGVGALVKSVDARKLTELVRTRGIERDAAESMLYRLFRIQDDPVLLATQEVKQGEGIWKVVMNPTDGLSRSRIDDANRILDAVYGPAPKGP